MELRNQHLGECMNFSQFFSSGFTTLLLIRVSTSFLESLDKPNAWSEVGIAKSTSWWIHVEGVLIYIFPAGHLFSGFTNLLFILVSTSFLESLEKPHAWSEVWYAKSTSGWIHFGCVLIYFFPLFFSSDFTFWCSLEFQLLFWRVQKSHMMFDLKLEMRNQHHNEFILLVFDINRWSRSILTCFCEAFVYNDGSV